MKAAKAVPCTHNVNKAVYSKKGNVTPKKK
jgi:hypothetical protein